MIIKTGADEYMEIGNTAKLSISDIDNQIKAIQEATPVEKTTDNDLLEWAKENYQFSGEKQMIDLHTKMIADLIDKKTSLLNLKIGETNG